MKRIVAFLLSFILILTGCATPVSKQTGIKSDKPDKTEQPKESDELLAVENIVPEFKEINDISLLTYIEDSVYAELDYKLEESQYIIENVSAVFISQEYIDELAFNSQSNVYFGYTSEELNTLFQDSPYIFTLGDDGKTIVKELETVEDGSIGTIIKNVAIGSGVILICVTVSCLTAEDSPEVSSVFAIGAKEAAIMALSGEKVGTVAAEIVRGIETGDMSKVLDAAAGGSEEFKWNAISGAVKGIKEKTLNIQRANSSIPTPAQSVLKALEKYVGATGEVSFLDGVQVEGNPLGSTRPDVVVPNSDGTVKAVEVKNYDLKNNLSSLLKELKRQIADRIENLPEGSTQEIVLDVTGRKYSELFIKEIISVIKNELESIYRDIPVVVMEW